MATARRTAATTLAFKDSIFLPLSDAKIEPLRLEAASDEEHSGGEEGDRFIGREGAGRAGRLPGQRRSFYIFGGREVGDRLSTLGAIQLCGPRSPFGLAAPPSFTHLSGSGNFKSVEFLIIVKISFIWSSVAS